MFFREFLEFPRQPFFENTFEGLLLKKNSDPSHTESLNNLLSPQVFPYHSLDIWIMLCFFINLRKDLTTLILGIPPLYCLPHFIKFCSTSLPQSSCCLVFFTEWVITHYLMCYFSLNDIIDLHMSILIFLKISTTRDLQCVLCNKV